MHKGTGIFNKKTTEIESYSLPVNPDYDISARDQELILEILENWLRAGYFKDGVTGYKLYQALLAKITVGCQCCPYGKLLQFEENTPITTN